MNWQLLIGIIGIIIGGTYAYLRWNSSDTQKTMVTFNVTPDFSCTADAGGNITSANTSLAPANCTDVEHAIKRIVTVNPTITGNNSIYLSMNLKVNSIDSGLTSTNNFKYAITSGDNDCTDGVVNSGNFSGATVNIEKELLNRKTYSSTTTETYYLWIWLDAAETNNNSQNQNFNLSITGSCESIS